VAPLIFGLDGNTPAQLQLIGGKGCGMVHLMRAGLPVPPTWCLPATAYDKTANELPARLRDELKELWRTLGERWDQPVVAVRSSAIEEDLDEASFAGLYRTVLGVSSEAALAAAVWECWSALRSEEARSYRAERQIAGDPAMAVLIQRLVRPTVAGVLLTGNPARPFARELAIDAAWGLGEAVVSGATDPDHFVLERTTGRVREERLGAKEVELAASDDGGTSAQPVEADRRARLCLSHGQRLTLVRLADDIERRIGPRRDVEWAFDGDALFLLQQRPITELPPTVPDNVWTRRFGDEYLADYTMPLSHGLLSRWVEEDCFQSLARMSGRLDLATTPVLRRHHGYVYMSGAYLASMMQAVPRPLRPIRSLGWFTPLWEDRLAAEPFRPSLAAGTVRAVLSDPHASPAANLRALSEHGRVVERLVATKLEQDYSTLSGAQWQAQYDEAYRLGQAHFRLIRWGMGVHNPALHALLRGLLTRWANDDDGDMYRDIVAGVTGTRTAQINRDIWALGREARKQPRVAAAIRNGDDYRSLRADTESADLWRAFDAVVARHGHRATTREIAHPRWCETPQLVLAFVRAQLAAAEPPPDPAHAERRSRARSRSATLRAVACLGGGPLGHAKRRLLESLISWTHRYIRYREDQRYVLDYILLHMRNLILQQGRRLTRGGALASAEEVFLLRPEELWPLVRSPRPAPELRERLRQRRRHHDLHKHRLPATFLFDDVETEGEIVEGDPPPGPRRCEEGLGASRGRALGVAKVVLSPADLDQVNVGDILVARNIDPGWTSVFPLLGGLVTETGGILSHGALLAREYGIPAVMGVRAATSRLEDGQLLEIDGSAGSVRACDGRR